jgi:hypothetical protein
MNGEITFNVEDMLFDVGDFIGTSLKILRTDSKMSRTVDSVEEMAIRYHVGCFKRKGRSVDAMWDWVNLHHGFYVEVDRIAENEWGSE